MRLFALLLTLLPGVAAAQDAALILGNTRYDDFGRVSGAVQAVRAAEDLRAMGFNVAAVENGRGEAVAEALAAFEEAAPDAERIVVALAGRFVTDGTRTWFLMSDADYPTLFGLDDAVSVESLLRVLSTRPGQAVLLLGRDASDDDDFGPFLAEGLGNLDIPQGVTVLSGDPGRVSDFLRGDFLEPAGDVIDAGRDARLTVSGYVPESLVLMPAEAEPVTIVAPPAAPDRNAERDAQAWTVADQADTVDAYRTYLSAFPDGAQAAEARDRIDAIEAEPNRDARLAEEALDLSRDERREIQRNLSLMDLDTRGIDGIFGPGTRTAITNWQQQNGYPQTSYLTQEQIARLAGQAARRQTEIEAEAEAERQAAERADRAFWDETGARGDEAGYRAYLGRYPNGLFAGTARDALAEIESARRTEAEAEDRTAWDLARQQDNRAAYEAYLQEYPNGVFRSEAQAAIEELTASQGPDQATLEAAQAAERALNLNPITARLVEAKLADLGLGPGTVDGQFTADTRAAIRQYQEARSIPATGYLSQGTVVRLLADSISDLQRN